MERLDKFLCDSGVGTRSQVKQILKTGAITVGGIPVKDGSVKIDPDTAAVCLRGQRLGGKQRTVLMLHKPAGFVTATEDATERTVMELLPPEYKNRDLKPVGRLDKATEGLIAAVEEGLGHRIGHDIWHRHAHALYRMDADAYAAAARALAEHDVADLRIPVYFFRLCRHRYASIGQR